MANNYNSNNYVLSNQNNSDDDELIMRLVEIVEPVNFRAYAQNLLIWFSRGWLLEEDAGSFSYIVTYFYTAGIVCLV